MIIPPRYRHIPELTELLSSIEASREVIDTITIPPEIERNIRRQSTLKSSLYSARIEGNEMSMDDLATASSTQKKMEIMNILKAMNFLSQKQSRDIQQKDILTMHEIAMKGLLPPDKVGRWRTNMEAIFNSAGIAIYMPPPPKQVPALIKKLIKYINSDREKFIPVKAALAHYSFEMIHPFLDGSGRVGRLVMQKILMQGGYGMHGLLSIEEYIEKHRSEYYRMLEEPEKDATDYLLFMLTAIDETAKEAKKLVVQKQQADVTDYLLPRRAEIYNIIKDHKMVNFDQIKRRFAKVNSRTLRYDLKKLQDKGLIKKRGSTRGVYYEVT